MNQSTHYIKRLLMLPQEIGLLPKEKTLLLIEGNPPIYADKIFWFLRFKNVINKKIPVPRILSIDSSITAIHDIELPNTIIESTL